MRLALAAFGAKRSVEPNPLPSPRPSLQRKGEGEQPHSVAGVLQNVIG